MLYMMMIYQTVKSEVKPDESQDRHFRHRYFLSKYFYPVVFIFIIIYNLL